MMLKMQSLLKRSKALLTVLLLAGVISSCQHAPKAPVIRLYIHDQQAGVAKCSRSDRKACDPVLIELTANWFMLPPSEWEKVQNYVDLLVCKIEGGCKDATGVNLASVSITPEDLKQFSKLLRDLRKNLESQRTDNEHKEL